MIITNVLKSIYLINITISKIVFRLLNYLLSKRTSCNCLLFVINIRNTPPTKIILY